MAGLRAAPRLEVGPWQGCGLDGPFEKLGEPAAGPGGGAAGHGARRGPEREAWSMDGDEASAAVGARQRSGLRTPGREGHGSVPEQPRGGPGMHAFGQGRGQSGRADPGGPGPVSQGFGGRRPGAARSRAQRSREPRAQAVGAPRQRGCGPELRPATPSGLRRGAGGAWRAMVGMGPRGRAMESFGRDGGGPECRRRRSREGGTT